MSTASYINVYIYVTCDRMAQNKNLLNKLITAEWSSFWHKLFCSIPASGYSYLILCPRKYKEKVAITYLALSTKNN